VIHFVVAAGEPAEVARLADRLSAALEATRLFDGERVRRTAANGRWSFAAIAQADPTNTRRWAADDDAVVALNGPALATGGRQDDLAADVLREFRAHCVADERTIGGTYNVVGATAATGLRACGDFSGLYPLYYGGRPGVSVVSTRSTTVRQVLGLDGWERDPLAWVIGHANLFGDRVSARGVRYVPPGYVARVDLDGALSVEPSTSYIWPGPSDDAGRDNLTDAEWTSITNTLVANLRPLRSFDGPVRLELTGGKDSRLCLALASAAGLRDRIETFTAGTFDSPEVECAAAVAKQAGFEHQRVGPPEPTAARAAGSSALPPAAAFNADNVWRRLRQDVYRYEAIVTGWSALQNPARQLLTVKGFGGEFYRRGNAKQFRKAERFTLDALAERFVDYHQQHDPMQLLRPRVAGAQVAWLKDWVHTTARRVRADLLPDKFYVDHRLGHWSGPLLQNAPARVNINPLVSSYAARKNLELSVAARSGERFHFEVMRRAAPELVGVPFLDDTWAPEVAVSSPVAIADKPFVTTVEPTTRVLTQGNAGWPFLEHEARGLERLFRDAARHTEMSAICRMRRLRRVARHAPELRKLVHVRTVLSAASAALALLERAEPVIDEP
jgi:hypothetical protein